MKIRKWESLGDISETIPGSNVIRVWWSKKEWNSKVGPSFAPDVQSFGHAHVVVNLQVGREGGEEYGTLNTFCWRVAYLTIFSQNIWRTAVQHLHLIQMLLRTRESPCHWLQNMGSVQVSWSSEGPYTLLNCHRLTFATTVMTSIGSSSASSAGNYVSERYISER